MGIGNTAAKLGIGKSESDLAWSRTKRMMQNRHQWEVKDLRAAGLNPILSAGGAPSMGSAPQPFKPEFAQDEASGTQRKLLQSQINLNKAGAAKATADGALSDAKRGVIRPASTIGEGVGGFLDAAGGAAKSLFKGFTGPQSNSAPKISIPDLGSLSSKFMKNIKRKKGESLWQFTKRKYLLWKAYKNNSMVEGDPSTY